MKMMDELTAEYRKLCETEAYKEVFEQHCSGLTSPREYVNQLTVVAGDHGLFHVVNDLCNVA